MKQELAKEKALRVEAEEAWAAAQVAAKAAEDKLQPLQNLLQQIHSMSGTQ